MPQRATAGRRAAFFSIIFLGVARRATICNVYFHFAFCEQIYSNNFIFFKQRIIFIGIYIFCKSLGIGLIFPPMPLSCKEITI